MIQAIYPEEAKDEGLHVGPANIHFLDVLRSKAQGCGSWCPTIVASDWTKELDPLNGPSSIPARMPVVRGYAYRELKHKLWNVLGVYAAGVDYAQDGIDRFMGQYTGCVVHTGDASESDKFVKLIAAAIRAMPENFRAQAASIVPSLIRHGQKCVRSEADFMSGAAHRPAISFGDVDEKRVLALARSLSEDAPLPLAPYFDQEHCGSSLDVAPVGDLWNAPYDRPLAAMSAHHICNMARSAEKTWTLQVAAFKPERGRLVWTVLQGDPEKIRIREQSGPENVLLEVDHHEAFDVALPDGKCVKSSRVDIGCFLVDKDVASVPAIVSVYFMPNETRTFRSGGKLESIDYTRRQYKGFCPRLCPKGEWKDCFHWNDTGSLTGWTRFRADGQGRVTTNEFTREGLVVDSRDSQGRPEDVHRSMMATWMQELEPTNMTGLAAERGLAWLGYVYDRDDRHPNETTLAWRYVYTNSTDVFGSPQPKQPKPFSCRPELCRRADFSDEESGFKLPLLDQMNLGYNIYAGYKHDVIGEDASDNLREDSTLSLKEQGLAPPEVLKKMRFCPCHSSSNDIWKVDMDDVEQLAASQLAELADGVYRIRKASKEDGAVDGYEYRSVRESYWTINAMCVNAAFAKLDAAYRRCKAVEVKQRLSDLADEDTWSAIHICEGKIVSHDEVPEGVNFAMAGWEIKSGLFFGIQSELSGPTGKCKPASKFPAQRALYAQC